MTNRLRAIGYGVERTARALRRSPSTTAIAVGAVAAALLLVAIVHLASRNMGAIAGQLGGGVHMIVYLEDGTGDDRAAAIASVLTELPAVEGVELVAPEVARERLAAALGEDAEVLDGIEAGMLPASLEVSLRAGVRDVAAVHPVVERLEATAGVDSVELLDDWAATLQSLLAALRLTALLLAMVVASACVFIIGATIRLGLQSRGEELRVMDLCGASASFVRGPVVLEGAIVGAVGAALASVALWFVYQAGADRLRGALVEAFGAAPLGFLPGADIAALILAGAALGAAGSWIALPRSHALA